MHRAQPFEKSLVGEKVLAASSSSDSSPRHDSQRVAGAAGEGAAGKTLHPFSPPCGPLSGLGTGNAPITWSPKTSRWGVWSPCSATRPQRRSTPASSHSGKEPVRGGRPSHRSLRRRASGRAPLSLYRPPRRRYRFSDMSRRDAGSSDLCRLPALFPRRWRIAAR